MTPAASVPALVSFVAGCVDVAEAAAASVEHVHSVDLLRLRWTGHQLRAEARLGVDPHLSLAQAHDVAHAAEGALVAALPRLGEATVHVHPVR